MAESNSPIGFFDLPPEIRDMIYDFVFPCRNRKAYNPVLHYQKLEPCICFRQPLMTVSRQMRSESVSLHYSGHEFHFGLYPPNKAVIMSWLDDVARDCIPYIRRIQLKHYVKGQTYHLGDRIKTITIDLNGEQSEMEIRVAGKQTALPDELHQLLCDLPYTDSRPRLSREKLIQMFDVIGWH